MRLSRVTSLKFYMPIHWNVDTKVKSNCWDGSCSTLQQDKISFQAVTCIRPLCIVIIRPLEHHTTVRVPRSILLWVSIPISFSLWQVCVCARALVHVSESGLIHSQRNFLHSCLSFAIHVGTRMLCKLHARGSLQHKYMLLSCIFHWKYFFASNTLRSACTTLTCYCR